MWVMVSLPVKCVSILFLLLHIHGVTTVGEVESALLLRGAEGESSLGLLRSNLINVTSLVLIREVLLDDVVCLHVDLLVGVVLAVMDLLHTTGLFDEQSVAVDVGLRLASLLVHLADLEDVLQTIQSNLDDLVVRASKKVAQGLDASLGHEVADLVRLLQTTGGGVGDGPAGLLTRLEVTVRQQVDQGRDDAGVDDSLDLAGVTSSDVGDGPARLLTDTVLGGAQQSEEGGKSTAVDDDLGLDVVTSDDVTDRPESGGLDRGRGVHEELDETARDAGLDDSLNLVVGAIRQVGDGPASIDQDFIIKHVDELSKDRKSGGNL